ncbi:hypothetical protein AAG906_010451 [Vitis piasezkii]
MDPLPPIAKVFPWLFKKRDNVLSTKGCLLLQVLWCHTIEKFYKLHGYPPCYKFKSKSFQSKAQVNQIASIIVEGPGASSLDSPLRISSKPHDNDSLSFQVC